MTDRMPDFAMPSEEEVAAERRAARESSPAHAPAETASADLPPPDPASRIPAPPPARERPSATSRRARAATLARNPVVAFVAGAALVSAGFLGVPSLTEWSEQGSVAQLQRVLDDYVEAVEAGDVEAALTMHRPDEQVGSIALMEAGVSPAELPIIQCDEAEPDGDGDVAMVACSITVGGFGSTGSSSRVRLERVDGSWSIAAGFEERADLRGWLFEVVAIAEVPMDGLLEQQESAWLLPGSYDVDTRSSEHIELVDLGGLGGLVVADGGAYLGVYAQPGADVAAAAEAQALAFVESCSVDAATAASCRIVPPQPGAEPTATAESSAYASDETTMLVPVRIAGTGSPSAPIVEVSVRFSADWTSFELSVAGVSESYP